MDDNVSAGGGFRINEKHVVYETFDEEILAVNIDTGVYYSLAGSSAKIWNSILGGGTVGSVVDMLSSLYTGDRQTIEAAVVEFFQQLLKENLVVPDPAATAGPSPAAASTKAAFVPPTMEIFSDMQDLLLLDPIHEVDEAGWPVLKPGADRGKEI